MTSKKLILLLMGFAYIFTGCDPEMPVLPDPTEETSINVSVKHTANGENIEFVSGEYSIQGYDLTINRIGYILSDFYLVAEDDSKIELNGQYAYLNPKVGNVSFKLTAIPKGTYKSIGFSLGLDSVTNHGDPNQYDVDHPLSPINNSLHWSWVGGYIFIALEGTIPSMSDSYLYHIAGSKNKVDYEIPFSFTKGDKALKAEFELMFDEIFKNPNSYDFSVDGLSTHSIDDPVTNKIVGNLGDIFKVNSIIE